MSELDPAHDALERLEWAERKIEQTPVTLQRSTIEATPSPRSRALTQGLRLREIFGRRAAPYDARRSPRSLIDSVTSRRLTRSSASPRRPRRDGEALR